MLISQQRITPRISDLFKRNGSDSIKQYVSKPHTYWVGSGREALRQILSHCRVKSNNDKLKVGIPAYTCHVVKDTIERAGCIPVFYDSGVVAEVDEAEKIISKIDVLLLCYNFGFLPEIKDFVNLCNTNNVILVEDCAQALGATYNRKSAGSFGDYAFYSFGISKNIGFAGGLIASNEEIYVSKLPKYPLQKQFDLIIKTIVSRLFFANTVYPFTKLFLNSELHKEQDFLSYACSPFIKNVILSQFERYDSIYNTRLRNGQYCYSSILKKDLLTELKGTPSWLYLVLQTENSHLLQKSLEARGIEVGRMLTFKSSTGNFPKAQKAEKEVLTFALYRSKKEIEKLVGVLNNIY
ncbi:MAG: DegT/DnrJ/EryC1/StrS family aminotransferase [archaeon]|nr:DegT/DnrJ/EryC1/StrS family aminotransferase [archaeon]